MSVLHEESAELFNGRHFNHELLPLGVRWYVTYQLRYRDLVERMAERHGDLAHTTIMRWSQRDVPAFAQRWRRYPRPVGTSWRCDETYSRSKGRGGYLYRAVDREGQTVDFFLSEYRDIVAAKRFVTQAIAKRGVPPKITLDGYAAAHVAVAALQEEQVLPADLVVRTNRYLNNVIEQDHRRVKQRVRPMLGLKCFAHTVVTISGIELVHQIKKGQFDVSGLCTSQARIPQVWEAVLAA